MQDEVGESAWGQRIPALIVDIGTERSPKTASIADIKPKTASYAHKVSFSRTGLYVEHKIRGTNDSESDAMG